MNEKEPLANGTNGCRDANGRFVKGNAGGPGNPHTKQVAALRTAMMKAVTRRDIKTVIDRLISKAKAGDLRAIDLLLNRLLGAPVQADIIERIEKLETMYMEEPDHES